MRSHVLSALTYPVQLVVGLLAYRKVQQTLYGQGTRRFSAEEIRSFRQQIWEYVHALLIASKRKSSETGDGDAIFWVLEGMGRLKQMRPYSASLFRRLCARRTLPPTSGECLIVLLNYLLEALNPGS